LRDILRDMFGKYPTTWIAEMGGLSAPRSIRTGTPVSLRASAAEMNVWAKANLGIEMRLCAGRSFRSGLEDTGSYAGHA